MDLMSKGGKDERAAAARRLLEEWVSNVPTDAGEAEERGPFNGISIWPLRVLAVGGRRALCAFKVPRHLTDGDGNWRAGAIATMIDLVALAAIVSATGIASLTVEFNVSYLSPAKAEEEVEIEATVQDHKGLFSVLEVVIRKRGGGALVALGKLRLAGTLPRQSKL